jgi:hypothetical protein
MEKVKTALFLALLLSSTASLAAAHLAFGNSPQPPRKQLNTPANPENSAFEDSIPAWAYVAFIVGVGVSVGAVVALLRFSRRKGQLPQKRCKV